mgnify:CR=1 FL=1
MTIYEIIKAAISVKQAAKHYGLNVNRNGMACCPFHNDRHPSLKLNEDYFFCFGCGAKGDVIDLVARLFDLSSYEAAQKLAADFGLDPKPPTAAAMVKPKRPYIRQFRENEMLCFRVLTDYLHLLEDWKIRYAPKTPEDALDDRFVEACQIVNGVLSEQGDELSEKLYAKQQAALAALPDALRSLPTYNVPLRAYNVTGIENIRALLHTDHVTAFSEKVHATQLHSLHDVAADLAASGKRVIFTMGKGGVGKTTVAAAIALNLAKMWKSVHLATTDPAHI